MKAKNSEKVGKKAKTPKGNGPYRENVNMTDMSKPLVGLQEADGVSSVMRFNSVGIWSLCDVIQPSTWTVVDLETDDRIAVTPAEIRLPGFWLEKGYKKSQKKAAKKAKKKAKKKQKASLKDD